MGSEEIEDRVSAIKSLPEFDVADWWLTFYLMGWPEKLNAVAQRLLEFCAVNLDGAEGGFLYPKLNVISDPKTVSALINQVEQISASHEVEVIAVEADTTSDVLTSTFRLIIHYKAKRPLN
jgi:hypothetical protein